jgi:hypothetical protein
MSILEYTQNITILYYYSVYYSVYYTLYTMLYADMYGTELSQS